ncbi:hypothetical protein HNY73_000616 [Argiope bruennichi]|uniref:Uncharacterized protein n=1 Tax=Argiope bruennichi TaxID=94029 RepID=A0A8T0FZV3_ARGBR|nr:hypothetical protein HNY73_000616 [Argiope bruennichi]
MKLLQVVNPEFSTQIVVSSLSQKMKFLQAVNWESNIVIDSVSQAMEILASVGAMYGKCDGGGAVFFIGAGNVWKSVDGGAVFFIGAGNVWKSVDGGAVFYRCGQCMEECGLYDLTLGNA